MNPASPDPPLPIAPWGLLLALVSAAFYTGTNICLRSVVHCDDIWVSCLKAVPTLALAALLVGVDRLRGRGVWPSRGVVAALFATALVAHWGGNVVFQVGLREIGLAFSVPLTFGVLIVGGAVMGRVFLAEPITSRSVLAMLVLVAAIALLSLGAGAPGPPVPTLRAAAAASRWGLVLGVAAASFSGLCYALMGIVMRRLATRRVPVSIMLLVISLTGVVTLGLGSVARVGLGGLAHGDGADISAMLGGGACNALAFLMLGKALELAPVVQVNSVNASQTAMAAVAGVLLFGEQATPPLVLGMALTVVGLVLISQKSSAAVEGQGG